MRITTVQQTAICELFTLYFGENDHIWLFGSRVDDSKKGGDIDLYIETYYDDPILISQKKITFLVELKRRIGDQKIDIIVNQINSNNQRTIYTEARTTGVKLK